MSDSDSFEGGGSDIEAVSIDGDVPGGKVQARLEDGSVVVADIRSVDPGDADYRCPVDWCLRRFESAASRNTHVGFRHSEGASQTQCEHCGEMFPNAPSSDQSYCSWDCKTAANQADRTCPMCRDDFTTYNSDDKTYCSRSCYYESSRADHRPELPRTLLRDIRGDGFVAEKLEGRAYAHLAPEWDRLDVAVAALIEREGRPRDYEAVMDCIRSRDDLVTPDDQLDLLDAVVRVSCLLTDDSIDHVGAQEVLAALDEATTMLEVQQAWRVSRTNARQICDRLGIQDSVTDGEAAAFKRAKKILDEGNYSFDSDEEAVWNRAAVEADGGQADD